MTTKQNSWGELFSTGGIAVAVLVGGTSLQAMEGFIAAAMLPSVVKDIGGIELFAWNTTLFIVASIMASLFAAVRPASIGPRAAYIIAAAAFAVGSLVCGLATTMPVLLAGRFGQGFGAGLIVAQSLSMLRIVFPQRLWPRAMALNSTVWGVATLLGPAVGGSFAEFGFWRGAFLAVVPAAGLLALGAWRVLPNSSESRPPVRLPVTQIALVIAIVLAISVASLLTRSPALATGLIGLAGIGVVLLGWAERRSRATLLPTGSFTLASPMSSLFGLVLILGLSITSDIFAPLFLQRLHGLSPLWAGYVTALGSTGWTIAAIISSGFTGRRVRTAITVAPVVLTLANIGMAIGLAPASTAVMPLALAGFSLLALGAGIGIAFQHLTTRILSSGAAVDNDKTSAALGMVQLFANGLGAAIGGVVVNAAGLADATGVAEVETPARLLFVVFAAIAALGIPLALLVSRRDAARPAVETAA